MTKFSARKWQVAMALLALTTFNSYSAVRLHADDAPKRCVPVASAKVASISQAEHAILCSVADRRVLIVGELHGGNETPDLVGSLTEDALASRPVRVGLEMPHAEQLALDTYLRSAGSDADKATLFKGSFWRTRDGRSSTAYFRLIDTLRALRNKGDNVNVFTMEPVYGDKASVEAAGGYQKVKERGMAQAIQHAITHGDPKQLVIALMGNFHSRYDSDNPSPSQLGPSVTEQLANERPFVVLPFARNTSAWNCQQGGCAVHSYTSEHAPKGDLPQFAIDAETAKGPTVVKLWMLKMTAALPARGA